MKIEVNTGLDGFVLVDKIIQTESQNISGIKTFVNDPAYLGLESLAQLGAYHVRFLTDFKRHAFLLKITYCMMPAKALLDGRYKLSGRLLSRSATAFSYFLQGEEENEIQIEGEFLFATVDYDRRFKRAALQGHYRKIFSCLKNGSKKE